MRSAMRSNDTTDGNKRSMDMRRRIDQFLTYLQVVKNCSENTTSAYRNDLMQFLRFASGHITGWDQVTKRTLVAYIQSLQEHKYASSTVARKVAAVKSFFHFMLDQKILGDDPTATLDSPKVKKRLPQILTPQDIEALLAQPLHSDDSKAVRDKAFLELLYATGMRVSELVSLDVGDVDTEEQTVRCSSRGNTASDSAAERSGKVYLPSTPIDTVRKKRKVVIRG